MRRYARSLSHALSVVALLSLAGSGARAQEAADPDDTMAEAEAASVVDADAEAARRRALLRRGSTYLGPAGGIHVVSAGSGAPRSFRLGIYTDFFFKNDYLYRDDDTRYVGGALSLSITPVEHLELSAAVTARNVRSFDRPAGTAGSDSYTSVGDPYLNLKTYGDVAKGVTVGGDVMLNFLTAPADARLDYAGTSVGLRGNLSFDLREMPAKIPLELRLNVGYMFDQSRKIVEDAEQERLDALRASGQTTDTTGRDEYRHLAPRNERMAYGVNRVDNASIALGLEAPLPVGKHASIHPLLEWDMRIPVNRQGYDCPNVTLADGSGVPGDDDCLKSAGAGAFPQRLTAGARVFPSASGFNLLAAVEVGLGPKPFVRELAPAAPYRVFFAAAYTVDLKPKSVVKHVEKRVEVPVAPKEGRLRGRVVERGPGTPIEGVQVIINGTDLSPMVTGADGAFVGSTFPPGPITLALTAEGYEPGVCETAVSPEGADAVAECSLVALPRVGSIAARVVGPDGAPVAGAQVQLTGPLTRTATTSEDGSFREVDLPPGEYQARVDQPGFLLSSSPVVVEVRKETSTQITLTPKPKKPLVVVQKTRLVLRGTVLFNTGTAELDARSTPLLTEIADVLLRMPEIVKVEVQGHTDNVGKPDYNLTLSQQRAESVKDWLVRAGVGADRMEAKGYGQTKPIAPNVSPAGKAKNRRVAFIITERATTLPPQ